MVLKLLTSAFSFSLPFLFLFSPIEKSIAQNIETNNETMEISVLIGTYTEKLPHVPNAVGEGVYVYSMNLGDSESIFFNNSQTLPMINPTYLEITSSKKYFYAVTESSDLDRSLIHGYQIDRDNRDEQNRPAYRYIDSWPIGGVGACHVRIDTRDRFVYVSNYNGGNIAAFKIDQETGKLEKRNFFQFTEFSNVVKDRQNEPHLHSSILDKRERFVFFADLGNDCVWRMNFSPDKGWDIDSKKKFQAPPGSGPRHMAFHPIGGKFLYVACELSNHVVVYEMSENGDLQQIQYEPTSKNGSGPGGVADIHASDDGRFVYVSTRFMNIITVFEIQKDGKLKNVQEIPCGGKIPRNFVMYEPWSLVLVANQDTSDITVFRRSNETGQLAQIHKTSANTPVCLKILD